MNKEYFENLEDTYKCMIISYITDNKMFKSSWIKQCKKIKKLLVNKLEALLFKNREFK